MSNLKDIQNATKNLENFIDNLDELSNNFDIDYNTIVDIYEILQSELAILVINDYDKIKKIIEYQKNTSIQINNCITYENICMIIQNYILMPENINIYSLKYDLTRNLIKINTNLILQKIYKTAPRLILNSKDALDEIIFKEKTAKIKLNETIKYIKNSNH